MTCQKAESQMPQKMTVLWFLFMYLESRREHKKDYMQVEESNMQDNYQDYVLPL